MSGAQRRADQITAQLRAAMPALAALRTGTALDGRPLYGGCPCHVRGRLAGVQKRLAPGWTAKIDATTGIDVIVSPPGWCEVGGAL